MGLIPSMPMYDWPERHAEVDIGWALGDVDLGLSSLACARVCAGQLLRCTISPALHKGT